VTDVKEVTVVKAEIIAIANHKGGVGKSFTAVNLAAGMAQGGWRILLVDCDPQGNSTSMFDPDDDVEFDIYDLIADSAPIDQVIRKTRLENLDIVGSTLAVAKLDMELVTMHRREERLAMALAPVYQDYDANWSSPHSTPRTGSSSRPTPASGEGGASTCSSSGHLPCASIRC
jgi:chromosome partitioning protein